LEYSYAYKKGEKLMNWLAQTTYYYTTDPEVTTAAAGTAIGVLLVWMLFYVAIIAIVIVAMWKIFVKAGKPGWAAIIPIYNMLVFLQIIGRPWWWLLLMFIPFVNIVISIVVAIDLGKAFGKDAAYSVVLLWFFSIIGYLMLGFGKDKYLGAPNKL